MKDRTDDLRGLGAGHTEYRFDGPAAEILETFPNLYAGRPYLIELDCPEFTSLCPKTGQPDFARIAIRYIAAERCIESKSLKLYLFSFRNHGAFMESIVNRILDDLVAACAPRWMEVTGTFNARGGISLTVKARHGKVGRQHP